MKTLQWTRKKPNKPGFYWARWNKSDIHIVKVSKSKGNKTYEKKNALYIELKETSLKLEIMVKDWEYAGPMTPPKESE